MFYNKEDIDNFLICLNCKNRFDVPKLLPCGEVICESCVLNKLNEEKNSIECPICLKEHEYPKDGLQTPKFFNEMLKLKPSPKYRGILIEELEKTLSELNGRIEDLKSHVDDSEVKIKNHTEKIKDEIEKSAQDMTVSIEKIKDGLCFKLDMYKNNRLRDVKNTMGAFIEESNLKFSEINELINDPNIEKIKDATLSAASLLETINKYEINLNELMEQIQTTEFIPKSLYQKEIQLGILSFPPPKQDPVQMVDEKKPDSILDDSIDSL